MPTYNYTPKDKELMALYGLKFIKHYPEKIALAKEAGHESYIKFVLATDLETKSTRKTGHIVGMEQDGVLKMLRKMGAPIRPRGGVNNKYGRGGKPTPINQVGYADPARHNKSQA